jgi:uncharacterized protein (DUF58 family)
VPATDVAARSDVLRRLELELLRRLDGRVSGDYHTTSLGPGSERAGARAYEPGDDARLIDWNLTARQGETHVRRTEADREVETWIVADRSASLDFGTASSEKRDVVLAATAAFGMLRLSGSNRVGVVVAGTDRLVPRPARQGRAAFLAALSVVHGTERQAQGPTREADLGAALRWVTGAVRRRAQVVVVSDFLDTDRWERELRLLGLRHDVVCVHVSDPRELSLPDVGILGVVDPETGRQRYVQTRTPGLRQRYAEAAAARSARIRSTIHASGADYLHLSTDRDWLGDTVAFVTRRRTLRTPVVRAGGPMPTSPPTATLPAPAAPSGAPVTVSGAHR